MKTRRALPARALIAACALAVVGFCAGAAVPDTASADGSSGGSQNVCLPGVKSTTTTPAGVIQTCTITAAFGTCIQYSSAPTVEQRCTFTQTSMSAEKRAIAIQVHNPEGFDGTQDGTQIVEVTQSGTSRKNVLDALQIADQCLGTADRYEGRSGDRNDKDRDGDRDDDGRCEDEDEDDNDDEERAEDMSALSLPSPVTQSQEAHQSIDATQTATGNGKNESKALQYQHLHQRASNAPEIVQSQNVQDRENACNDALDFFTVSNACYTIDQNADSGANISRLWQIYNLFQSARKTDLGEQAQGSGNPFNGGLSHGFDQLNTDTTPNSPPIQTSSQNERMTQRRDDTGAMTWYQHGPLRKEAGNQVGGDGATATMKQDSVLSSKPEDDGLGHQTDLLEIQCNSSGNCSGFQHARTNDDEATNSASGSSIFINIVCGDFYEYSPPITTCTPGPIED